MLGMRMFVPSVVTNDSQWTLNLNFLDYQCARYEYRSPLLGFIANACTSVCDYVSGMHSGARRRSYPYAKL